MLAERKGRRRCRYEGCEKRERGAIFRVKRRRRRCRKGGLREDVTRVIIGRGCRKRDG
jgi:hypothetical protein